MIRLIVRIDDANMAANVGGAPQTTYRTFDIDHPAIETLLKGGGSNNQNSFSYRTLVGAELINVDASTQSSTRVDDRNGPDFSDKEGK